MNELGNKTGASVLVVPTAENVSGSAAPSKIDFAGFEKIVPGDEFQLTKLITADDVEAFARLSGDLNPLHMSEEFAARTHFQRRVVHGMLVANYVSTLIGMRCPGPGALWSQQDFRWLAPVFIGDAITLTMRVTHKSEGARSLTIGVTAMNQRGKVVMEGQGIVTAVEERRQTEALPISEQVAFISGSARGLGATIASALAREGAMVVVNYRNNSAAAEELCSQIQSHGGRAIALEADVSSQVSVESAIEKARQEYKRPISILVNNAGGLPELQPFQASKWESWQATLDVHLRGAFHCTQAVVPGMIEQKFGRIVNVGTAFLRNTPPPQWSNYIVAKSALQALTRCLAVELGPHGIRVNMVSPGLVETGSIAGLPERLRKVQAMQTPLRRLASEEEVAAAITALCTKAGDFVTGADIPVCGGLQM